MLIGLFLKHIKAYKGINFVPIGSKYKFTTYIGENGVGKSSILEAVDSFFNCKKYPLNKNALSDGINTTGNEPFITPIFIIDKSRVTRQKKEFEKISSFFWEIEKKKLSSGVAGSMKQFFELRQCVEEEGLYSQETHYLIVAGESDLGTNIPKLHFASFQGEKCFRSHVIDGNPKSNFSKEELKKELEKKDWKHFLTELKDLYSYVYFPVELDVESFTKIETAEMQKIFDKKITDEIKNSLSSVNFDKVGGINTILNSFVQEIEEILNNEYCYDTGQKRNNTVTLGDLVNKILEAYFQKRVLNKKHSSVLKKVSELSAGEKRQALIELVYAFLKRSSDREKMVIIGVDEPENSLHTSLCYDQFEKLKEISKNNQILITTHWYGFLPIISEGHGHFLKLDTKQSIEFESYDMYDYRAQIKSDVERSKNKIPSDFILKSTYDLVQSIFYSLKRAAPYNWIICEGVSEKIYFEYFFKDEIKNNNLRILPMGGQKNVVRLYKYLSTPMGDSNTNGKVFCLIDTDQIRCSEEGADVKNLKIRRLSNSNDNKKTELLSLNNSDTSVTDIEQALHPIVFKNAIESFNEITISKIENKNGNTDFINNFKNLELATFFKENDGKNKILFAKKYVEVSTTHDSKKTTPSWVSEIKKDIE